MAIIDILMATPFVTLGRSIFPDGLAHTMAKEAFPDRGLSVPVRTRPGKSRRVPTGLAGSRKSLDDLVVLCLLMAHVELGLGWAPGGMNQRRRGGLADVGEVSGYGLEVGEGPERSGDRRRGGRAARGGNGRGGRDGIPERGLKGPEQDVEDGPGGPGPMVEEGPQALRDREHELAHGQVGENVIHQVGGRLGHALGVAGRAGSSALAGERHQEDEERISYRARTVGGR
jgi:hypothetical protein